MTDSLIDKWLNLFLPTTLPEGKIPLEQLNIFNEQRSYINFISYSYSTLAVMRCIHIRQPRTHNFCLKVVRNHQANVCFVPNHELKRQLAFHLYHKTGSFDVCLVYRVCAQRTFFPGILLLKLQVL